MAVQKCVPLDVMTGAEGGNKKDDRRCDTVLWILVLSVGLESEK